METIDQAFAKMIGTYQIHKKLGIAAQHVRVLRYQLEKGITISLDKKHRLLRQSGWKPDAAIYTHQDLLDAVKFTIKSGNTAKQFGAGYVVEKWKQTRK